MTVGGVYDIHVSPDQRSARWGERSCGEFALAVSVIMGVVVSLFAWACEGRAKHCQQRDESRRELHG